MSDQIITLKDIFFQYPNSDFQIRLDDFSIQAGSKTALIGPSGFGKTTLLNLISGIIAPEKGSILVHNEEVSRFSETQRRNFRITKIGFVFQDFKLLEYLNVKDNILLPYRINNALKLKKETFDRIEELVTSLGIEDKLPKYPKKLSQGERQRVAICRALLNNPPIILADEPTGNLDPENKARIMDILYDQVDQKGSTLITVTHDHELLKGFDKVVDFKTFYAPAI